jgi:hypothetical protein
MKRRKYLSYKRKKNFRCMVFSSKRELVEMKTRNSTIGIPCYAEPLVDLQDKEAHAI